MTKVSRSSTSPATSSPTRRPVRTRRSSISARPTFKKIKVNGPDADPIYKWLKEQKKGKLNSNIKWNFTKFLLDREGNVVARYAPTETPEKIDAKVAALL